MLNFALGVLFGVGALIVGIFIGLVAAKAVYLGNQMGTENTRPPTKPRSEKLMPLMNSSDLENYGPIGYPYPQSVIRPLKPAINTNNPTGENHD